jgi:hypothetical protein
MTRQVFVMYCIAANDTNLVSVRRVDLGVYRLRTVPVLPMRSDSASAADRGAKSMGKS